MDRWLVDGGDSGLEKLRAGVRPSPAPTTLLFTFSIADEEARGRVYGERVRQLVLFPGGPLSIKQEPNQTMHSSRRKVRKKELCELTLESGVLTEGCVNLVGPLSSPMLLEEVLGAMVDAVTVPSEFDAKVDVDGVSGLPIRLLFPSAFASEEE